MRIPTEITTKAKLRYAWLHEPNKLTEKYQVDLYDLPKETKKILFLSEFITKKQYEDEEYKLTVKRKTPSNVTINDHEFYGVIGNGTEAIVTIKTMLVTVRFSKLETEELFVSTMKDIKITDLVTTVEEKL
jgi:hypothetical protein